MITPDNKQQPLTAYTTQSIPKNIRVVAPTNLPGGYQLEVQTDNDPPISFTATVPMPGVSAGDVFLTPPPLGYSPPVPTLEAPTGRWRDGLCDFFSYGACSAQAWMSICCTEMALGQMMQRMRLTWTGGLTPKFTPVNTFKTVLVLVICYHIFDGALGTYVEYNAVEGVENNAVTAVTYIKNFVAILFSFWSIYALYRTRKNVRETYSIPEQNCVGCEDLCCSVFCACCTVGQISRHTGDYDQYPSFCCTETGLHDNAPTVV